MITEEVERMSGRALRRTFPSICTRADRERVYAPGISFTGHSRFFTLHGCPWRKSYDACMWTLCTVQDVNVYRINVDAKKIIYRELD